MKIKTEILNIIDQYTTIEGNVLKLVCGQLDRKTYEDVNKCLESIGGKWNRKLKGHLFEEDPSQLLDNLILTGETVDLKKTISVFFQHRVTLQKKMCNMAELTPDSNVLEPSVGNGQLADVIYEHGVKKLLGIELNRDMDKQLKDKPYATMTGVDFLEFANEVQDGKIRQGWDRIIMNPPFSNQQDVSHIYAAYAVLADGGILVSIVSESPFFRTNKKICRFS